MARLRSKRRKRIIVIEDDEYIATALRDLLEHEGYDVASCSTLRQATNALANIDGRCLVLLDPLVPNVTASAVVEALRDEQALITVAMAVYPHHGGKMTPPGKSTNNKRLISPELLLEMVAESFADGPVARVTLPQLLSLIQAA